MLLSTQLHLNQVKCENGPLSMHTKHVDITFCCPAVDECARLWVPIWSYELKLYLTRRRPLF